jgi:hypothetical protein
MMSRKAGSDRIAGLVFRTNDPTAGGTTGVVSGPVSG